MTDSRLTDFARRMDGAIEALRKEFAGLRTGRASVNLLDHIHVEAYGGSMPLNQVGTVSVREAGLGLNPQQDGGTIRVPIPELNEERRTELAKIAGKYAEQARVAIRNVRRDAMEMLKRLEKEGDISEDEHENVSSEVQRLTDQHIKRVDEAFQSKEKEIKQI
jgi:ribosome recycling factor